MRSMVDDTQHPSCPMTTGRFPKSMRLLRSRDFEQVMKARVSASTKSIVIFGVTNELGYPRLGLTASRKLGGAVERNRWKRVVREAFRLTQHELPALDLVCVPRAGAEPELQRLLVELPATAARIDQRLRRSAQRSAGKSP